MSENRLRITAQLIDTIKGNHIWSERYERNLKDLFAVQDEISLKILTELGVKLTLGEEARLWAKGTKDIEAYLKVLQGRHYINLQSEESNIKARQMAKEAIALDPDFPTAYTLLGSTHLVDVWLGSSKSSKESLEQAEKLYRKAIALDDSFAPAHSALCHVYVHKRLYEEAIAEGERAVALNPSAAPAYAWLGTALRFAGRPEDAVSTYEKAMRLDPYPSAVLLQGLGGAYHMAGRYEEALKAFKRALHRDPDNMFVHLSLARTYSALNLEREAQAAAAEVMKIDPEFSLHRFAKILPYKNQVDKDCVISELRKAGLPEHPPLKLPDNPSIAVLPFDNMSGDAKQDYFIDGLTDQIISALSKIPHLFVIARNSTFTYKGKPVKVQQVARELGVRYVLEGSVQKAGDRVRITAQLVNALDGHHIWSDSYDRELKDIFAIQDEITMEIVTAMQVKLTSGEQARLLGKSTKKLGAYLKFLEGLAQGYRWNKEANVRAKQLIEEAIALDPEFGLAYSNLGSCHFIDGIYGWSKSPSKSIQMAFDLAQKALSIDASLAHPHWIIGYIYLYQGQHDKAIAEAEQAVELNPNGARAISALGWILRCVGKPEEAIPLMKKAIRLDPIPPVYEFDKLGRAYFLIGKYKEAIVEYKKAVQVNPDYLDSHIGLASTYAVLGRKEEAQAETEEIIRIDPNFSIQAYADMMQIQVGIESEIEGLRKAGLPE